MDSPDDIAQVTTPGGVIEWTASDGRRGRLTRQGKPRLTAVSLVQVPKSKAPSAKATDEDEGGMVGLFEDAPAMEAAPAKAADDDQPANSDWTKKQDDKLMELKGENKPWAKIASEVDKKEYECQERFKRIKPKDWKPSNAEGGGGGKQGKQKNKQGKKQQDGDKKDDDKKDGVADVGFDANAWPGGGDSGGNNDNWGGNNNTREDNGNKDSWNNDSGDNNDTNWGGGSGDTWGATDNKSEKKDKATDAWDSGGWGNTANNDGGKKADDGFKNEGWGGGSGDNAATGDWDNNDTSGNPGGGDGAWNSGGDGWAAPANDATKYSNSKKASSTKDSSSDKANKGSSNKSPSQSGSKHRSFRSEKASSSAPKEYELKTDSTFSTDDLRLIAKILQQDCSMVWNRVSWRFKDKTGRNLHPDVFEKKITGRIEDRDSDRGGW